MSKSNLPRAISNGNKGKTLDKIQILLFKVVICFSYLKINQQGNMLPEVALGGNFLPYIINSI